MIILKRGIWTLSSVSLVVYIFTQSTISAIFLLMFASMAFGIMLGEKDNFRKPGVGDIGEEHEE